MSLTPADIHNTTFKKSPIGKRGYDEDEVDALLDEAEQELIRLLEENRALQYQVQRDGGDGGGAASEAAFRSEQAELAAQLDRMEQACFQARQHGRQVQAQLERARSSAPSASEAVPGDEGSVRVLLMAQRTADDHMRDAQRESHTLLSEARSAIEQIASEA